MTGKQQNKTLLILGMHRSGTSLFTNWLHDCGLHVGERLLGKMDSNKKGHFEDLDFMEFHREVIDENHTTEYTEDAIIKISTERANQAKRIVALKNKVASQWGFKDPKTCIFLSFWEETIPYADKIVVFRSYKDVVTSLIRRRLNEQKRKMNYVQKLKFWIKENVTGINVNAYAKLYLNAWCFYNYNLLKHYKNDTNVLFVSIDDLEELQDDVFIHLNQKLGYDIEKIDFSNVFDSHLWRSNPINFTVEFDVELEKKAQHILHELYKLQNSIPKL